MRASQRALVERSLQELCARGEVRLAVEGALEVYGAEIQRLLAAVLRHEPELARDAYSLFCESLLRDLPAFRWESSFRTWAFRVARNLAYRLASSPVRREQSLSQGVCEQVAHAERTPTVPWLRTSIKARFRDLHEKLDPDERLLLVLRVDRRLSWLDVAREMAGPGEAPPSALLQRKAAVLRQQFRHLKERLRALAREDLLLSMA